MAETTVERPPDAMTVEPESLSIKRPADAPTTPRCAKRPKTTDEPEPLSEEYLQEQIKKIEEDMVLIQKGISINVFHQLNVSGEHPILKAQIERIEKKRDDQLWLCEHWAAYERERTEYEIVTMQKLYQDDDLV